VKHFTNPKQSANLFIYYKSHLSIIRGQYLPNMTSVATFKKHTDNLTV